MAVKDLKTRESRNETKKLYANALDRLSTTTVAAGLLTPIVSYMVGPSPDALELIQKYGALFCSAIFGAFLMHLGARQMISDLEDKGS